MFLRLFARHLRLVSLSVAILMCCYAYSSEDAQAQPTSVRTQTNPQVDVFLLAGQSNMEGVGRVKLLPKAALSIPNVYLFHSSAIGAAGSDGKWLPLRPAGWKGTLSGGFGVEMSLGAALSRARPRRPIYLIKHAVGGTALFDDWNPSNGPQHLTFQRLTRKALADLEAQGLDPIVRGMFWQQGEADAKTPEKAWAFGRRLENFIVRTRAGLAAHAPDRTAAKIRFVLGQVIPDAAPGSRARKSYPFREDIRAAQLAVSHNLSNVVTVPTDASFETHASDHDGYRDTDNIHFNGAGLLKLGQHMAAAYLRAQSLQEPRQRVTLLPTIASAPEPKASSRGALRVISYNTYYVFSKATQIAAATQWITGQAPDIVALQELTNITPERLSELGAGWGHQHSALLKTSGFSVGITSARPIEIIERITESLHHGCLHVRIAGVHIFVVHLSPFRWEKRKTEADILLAKIKPLLAKDMDLLVLGDFNALSPADRQLMASQPNLLKKAIERDAAHEHVENLSNGHFDFSVMQRFLDAGLQDTALPFLEQSQDERWTFPTNHAAKAQATPPPGGTRIDHILASDSMAHSVVSAFIPRHGTVNQTSDHYPVIVEFH